jgi:hypothetical protein
LGHLADSRKQQSRGRRALGLFAAVWLNLALAPCAMAVEADDDHDCPHCPPAAMQGHHEMHGGMQAKAPCADDLSDCGLDDEFSHDARGGNIQLKEVNEIPALAVSNDSALSELAPVQPRAPPSFETGPPPAGPPVYLLNCVFLD